MDASASQDAAASQDVLDGFEWITIPAGGVIGDDTIVPTDENVIVHTSDDPFAALAARRAILDAMFRSRGTITQLATLDHLHAIAVEQGIVTPYSSMIVLVNQTQEKRLDELEGQADRFQREGENVGETQPVSPFQVTGVPEPHEWLLIGLAAVMLAGYMLTKRRLAHRRY